MLYEIPEFKFKIPKPKLSLNRFLKKSPFLVIILAVFISSVFGFASGVISSAYFYQQTKHYLEKQNINLPSLFSSNAPGDKNDEKEEYVPQTSQEEAIVKAVKLV